MGTQGHHTTTRNTYIPMSMYTQPCLAQTSRLVFSLLWLLKQNKTMLPGRGMKSSVHFDVFVCLSCHTEYTTMWNNSNKSQSNCWIVIMRVYLNESLYVFAVCVYVWAYILSQESSFRPLSQTSLAWLQCQAPDLQKKRIAVVSKACSGGDSSGNQQTYRANPAR